jgi:hypothetical protein
MPFFRRNFAVFALGFGGTPSRRAHFYALLSAVPLFFGKISFFSVSFLPIRYNALSLRASLHGVPAIFFKKGVDKSVYS